MMTEPNTNTLNQILTLDQLLAIRGALENSQRMYGRDGTRATVLIMVGTAIDKAKIMEKDS